MFEVDNNGLYVEKYRPSTLDGYVGNQHIIDKCKIWLAEGEIPHLLLHGSAGTGKTTLAKILASSVDATVMYINASDENSVDTVRDKIKSFASTMSFQRWKIIICDEFDFMTVNGQAALRNLMETFSKTTRFILTCNYVEKIIDPIQSRCQVFAITPPSKKDVAVRVSEILNHESVKFIPTDLVAIVNSGYPDIRRILNACQRQVVNGELTMDKQSLVEANYMNKIIEILSANDDKKTVFNNIRQLLADSQVKDYSSLYRFLYDNLESYATGHIASVILIIADAQYKDSFIVDKEIGVMSMFIQLLNEIK
jgi:DNA polymerase III delta prime subunit